MANKNSKWLNKYDTLDDSDHQGLETAAAIHEFTDKLSRPEAEAKAHLDYTKNKALEAAAHHYLGMKAAMATNHESAAKQHGEAYARAIKYAGHSPYEAPPQKLLDLIKDNKSKVYNFKGHDADVLFEEKVPELPKPGLLDRLKAMKVKLTETKEPKQ
jgi:hypothetical protein